MASITCDEALIDRRRDLVSRFKARGYSVREIVDKLAAVKFIDPETGEELPFVNPDTGVPWCRATVQNDITAIRKRWQERANRRGTKIFSEMLAELEEAIHAAWDMNDIGLVLRGLKDKRELLGYGGSKTLKLEHSLGESDETRQLNTEDLTIDQLTTIAGMLGYSEPVPHGARGDGAAAAGQPSGDIIETTGRSPEGAGPAQPVPLHTAGVARHRAG